MTPGRSCATRRCATRARTTLAEPLAVTPKPAAEAAETLGLLTVGDLLEHLPRDTGVARTIGDLAIDETATVIAEVRSIRSRPVRRRGMKPLVEAVVGDASGTMSATFFNQPWLARQYLPGHAADAERQVPGPQPVPRRRPTRGPRRSSRRATTWRPIRRRRGSRRPRSAALVGAHRGAIADVVEPLPARLRVHERLPDRVAARGGGALRRHGGRPRCGWRSTSCCSSRSSSSASARSGAARRVADADRLRARRVGAVARRPAAVRADRRPGCRDGAGRRRPRAVRIRCSGC